MQLTLNIGLKTVSVDQLTPGIYVLFFYHPRFGRHQIRLQIH